MKKIMVAAMSQDGYIASFEKDPMSWVSKEDAKHFAKLRDEHNLFIMGRKTFEVNMGNIVHETGLLRVVMTNEPGEYHRLEKPEQLEFTKKSPRRIIEKYEDKKPSCLILGGSVVYDEFLEAGLVDEIYLTVETAVELGNGIPLLDSGRNLADFPDMPYPEITDLNASGTQLLHYTLN